VSFLLIEAFLVVVTETLSVGRALSFGNLTLVWVAALVVLVLAALPHVREKVTARARRQRTEGAHRWNVPLEAWCAVFAVSAVALALAVQGALYPPSNGDSLVYHLARVAHWIQDRGVAHFATHYLAQIELAPLAEYNLLHVQLLSGGDRLDGYVQWFAVIVCAVGASELTRLLGGTLRSQAIAAVASATIPSLILEGASTQNNLFAAALGVAWLVVVLGWDTDARPWVPAALFGVAAGLGWLAKGTIVPMLGPAVTLLFLARVLPGLCRGLRVRRLAGRVVMLGAIVVMGAVIVAGPFVSRNVELFGRPTGPVSSSTLNSDPSPRAWVANTLRSVALDFRIGNGSDGVMTATSELVLRALGRAFDRVGIAADDSRYFIGTDFEAFAVRDYSSFERLEDFGANPWHALLLIAAAGVLVVARVRGAREVGTAVLLAVGLACGFLLFSATTRWSPFATRYQIPLLVAWSSLIGLAAGRLRRPIGLITILVLAVACLPQLLDNGSRSLVHPTNDFSSPLAPYFADQRPNASAAHDGPTPAQSYERVVRAVAHSSCRRLGIANWILLEYPLWAGLRDAGWRGAIEHVGVTNASGRLARRDFRPCALVQEHDEQPPQQVASDWIELDAGDLVLWLAPGRSPRPAP